MDNKILKNPYIEFMGSNSHEVTGSMDLIRYMGYHILIDYGLRQTSKDEEDYKVNKKRHKDIRPKKLDAILITHSHADHQSLLPQLYRDGCDCPVFIPKGTKGLLQIMLQDSVKIFLKEAEKSNRQPLYTQEDVDNTMRHIVEVDKYKPYQINENITFTYYNAQHIVKACQIYMELTDGIVVKKLGFTGDFSNYDDRYYLDSLDDLPQVDLLVGESTYSDSTRLIKAKDRKKDIEKIDMAIKYALEHKSKVIIPTFSLDRLQVMLAVIYDMYDGKPPIKILVDSPLGKQISRLWEKLIDKDNELWNNILNWDSCHWIRDFKDTMHFSAVDEPMLILAGGGMLQGGRATYWVKEHLGVSKNRILFCGYATEESIAGQIKNGKLKEIKIDGYIIKNKAQITTLNSFSSHADRKHLIEYYKRIQYTKLCLVHSQQESKIQFAKDLQNELSKLNRTSKVICTNYETKVHF